MSEPLAYVPAPRLSDEKYRAIQRRARAYAYRLDAEERRGRVPFGTEPFGTTELFNGMSLTTVVNRLLAYNRVYQETEADGRAFGAPSECFAGASRYVHEACLAVLARAGLTVEMYRSAVQARVRGYKGYELAMLVLDEADPGF